MYIHTYCLYTHTYSMVLMVINQLIIILMSMKLKHSKMICLISILIITEEVIIINVMYTSPPLSLHCLCMSCYCHHHHSYSFIFLDTASLKRHNSLNPDLLQGKTYSSFPFVGFHLLHHCLYPVKVCEF